MDEMVAHTGNEGPRDLRVTGAKIPGQALHGFTKDRQLMEHSRLGLEISQELIICQTC